MKKIVVIPTFCESHLVKHQIPNIIDTIDPDYIVYREGMFPNGTEGNKNITKEWLDNYTLDGKRGFDFNELKSIIVDAKLKYPNKKIILDEVNYEKSMSSTDCFVKACIDLNHLDIKFEIGDCIFPFEADVFHHESSKKLIDGYINQIEPNQGFRSIWIDYCVNQYYCEEKDIISYQNPDMFDSCKSRRICIKYGGDEFLYNVLSRFMTIRGSDVKTGYGILYPTDLVTYHYCWFRFGKFKQLRFDQLQRGPGYWDLYNTGLEKCNELKYKKVTVRPWLNGKEGTYLRFFNKLEHPSHIKSHPCYINVDEKVIDNIEKNNLTF